MFTVVQLQGATLWALLEMITHNGQFCKVIMDQQPTTLLAATVLCDVKNQKRQREFFSSIRAEMWLNSDILRCSWGYINEEKSTSGSLPWLQCFLWGFIQYAVLLR